MDVTSSPEQPRAVFPFLPNNLSLDYSLAKYMPSISGIFRSLSLSLTHAALTPSLVWGPETHRATWRIYDRGLEPHTLDFSSNRSISTWVQALYKSTWWEDEKKKKLRGDRNTVKDLNQGFQLPRQSFICTHAPTAHDVLHPPPPPLSCSSGA